MGIKGKDFVLVAGDTSATQQIITIKHDEDKLVPIDDHKLMCLSGILTNHTLASLQTLCSPPIWHEDLIGATLSHYSSRAHHCDQRMAFHVCRRAR